MRLKAILKAAVVLLIAAWLISPIPEVSLIIGFITSWLLFESYSLQAVLIGTGVMLILAWLIIYLLDRKYGIEEKVIVWLNETDSETLRRVQERLNHPSSESSETKS